MDSKRTEEREGEREPRSMGGESVRDDLDRPYDVDGGLTNLNAERRFRIEFEFFPKLKRKEFLPEIKKR